MNKRGVEIAVGIFVLIGLICIGYLTIRLGKMEIVGGNYYEVGARFNSVSGLKAGALVEMAGVQVGKVDRVELEPQDKVAVAWLKIDRNVEVTDDVIASIRTNGLIGDKYIRLEPGGGTKLAAGDMITETESAVDIEELIGKFAFGDVSGGSSDAASAPQEEEFLP